MILTHLILLSVLLTLELTAAHYLSVLLYILSSVCQVMSEATPGGLRLLKHFLLVEYSTWQGARQALSSHSS